MVCSAVDRIQSTFPEVATVDNLDLNNKADRETLKNLVEVVLQKVRCVEKSLFLRGVGLVWVWGQGWGQDASLVVALRGLG